MTDSEKMVQVLNDLKREMISSGIDVHPSFPNNATMVKCLAATFIRNFEFKRTSNG